MVETIKKYLDKQKIKVAEIYDFENEKVKYSEKIQSHRKIEKLGSEEVIRVYLLTKLVNELGYKLENKEDKSLTVKEIIEKYQKQLLQLTKYDNDTKYYFGLVNTWWVFGEVAKKVKNCQIFMAEVENIGYKRSKRGEKTVLNELFRTNNKGEILIDDEKMETALDYLRKIRWD